MRQPDPDCPASLTGPSAQTYLRAGYLPQPYAADSQELLRQYVPLRINVPDRKLLAANFERSTEIQAELWAIAEELARDTPDSVVLGLYIESLNRTIDLHATRATAIIYASLRRMVIVVATRRTPFPAVTCRQAPSGPTMSSVPPALAARHL